MKGYTKGMFLDVSVLPKKKKIQQTSTFKIHWPMATPFIKQDIWMNWDNKILLNCPHSRGATHLTNTLFHFAEDGPYNSWTTVLQRGHNFSLSYPRLDNDVPLYNITVPTLFFRQWKRWLIMPNQKWNPSRPKRKKRRKEVQGSVEPVIPNFDLSVYLVLNILRAFKDFLSGILKF